MIKTKSLSEAFREAEFRVGEHSKRNVQVLKEAFKDVSGNIESDFYGRGKVIDDFQDQMMKFLGKESAVFFPSGTMAQQIALRIWCDEKKVKKVAYHPLCHLELHEEDGLKKLHHIESILLADKDQLITLADVQTIQEDIACLVLELPQSGIGGQLPDYTELQAISAYCREKGIKLHLDGARLFEILPYYEKTAAEVCSLFDSVYISFYKGIGGIAGAVLAGTKAFTSESKIWKRRYGGDLISLYPYVISSDYYFKLRINKMAQYYEEAKELAKLYNQCPGVKTIPENPVSNMFHVHMNLPEKELEPILVRIYETTGIAFTSYLQQNGSSCSYETNTGDNYAELPKEKLRAAFSQLEKEISKIAL